MLPVAHAPFDSHIVRARLIARPGVVAPTHSRRGCSPAGPGWRKRSPPRRRAGATIAEKAVTTPVSTAVSTGGTAS
eukprot:366306-Chlamydomonas_euryale.AAC.3